MGAEKFILQSIYFIKYLNQKDHVTKINNFNSDNFYLI
jgi:hypothetical protein